MTDETKAGEFEKLEAENRRLRRKLKETRETLESVLEGEVDAVLTRAADHPILLERAQKAMRDNEAKFRAVFDGALDAMVIADDDGVYIDANEAAADLYGLPRDELIGRSAHEFSNGDFDVDAAWAEFLEIGSASGEFPLVTRSGETRITEFAARANILPGRHLSVLRDITERKEMENRLTETQKMEAIGRLAGGIAHDFNNMLAAILGFARMLRDDFDADDPRRQDTVEIIDAAERASNLTAQLLAFGRRQRLRPQVVCPNDLLEDLQRMLSRLIEESIDFTLDLDDHLGCIEIDPVQFEQVIINLVVNAKDALRDGTGKLTVETRRLPPDELDEIDLPVDADGDAPWLLIRVSDTGAGMDEETQRRIFDPFFTTKETGSGLGLSTVYGLVRQSGGEVTVESTPGEGTLFSLYFPESAKESSSAPIREESEAEISNAREGTRILICEDEAAIRRLIERVLGGAGYDVVGAGSPAEALELVDTAEQPFDVVISDVVMPGMSGPELVRRLRRSDSDLAVVLISGYAPEGLDIDIDGAEFLPKPFTPDQLRAAIDCVVTG